jgi:hypothetical protein
MDGIKFAAVAVLGATCNPAQEARRRAGRLMAIEGGQVLVSATTAGTSDAED